MNKHFTIDFEYETGYIETYNTDLLIMRGVRHNGLRPAYLTITCNRAPKDYICTKETIELVHNIQHNLSAGNLSFRVTVKPIWFNKLINKGN